MTGFTILILAIATFAGLFAWAFIHGKDNQKCPNCKGTGRVPKAAPIPRGVPREYDHPSDCACSLCVEDAPEGDKK